MNRFHKKRTLSALMKTNAFFIKLVAIFFSFVIICTTLFSFINTSYITKEMRNLMAQSRMDSLNQVKNMFEQHYFNLYDITKQLSLNKQVNKCLYITDTSTPETQIAFRDMINNLKSLCMSNEYVDNISIFFHKPQEVVTQMGKYKEDFYFSNNPDLEQSFFQEDMGRIYPFGFRYSQRDQIVFSAPIPLYEPYPQANVYITVNGKVFYNLIEKLSGDIPAYTLIIDPLGRIVTEYSKNIDASEIAQIDQLIMDNLYDLNEQVSDQMGQLGYEIDSAYSEQTQYRFVSLSPTGYIAEKLQFYKNINRVSMGILIFFSLLFSLAIVYKIYKPIKAIVNYIKLTFAQEGTAANELDFINSFIAYLVKENTGLKHGFSKSHSMAQQRILRSVLDAIIDKEQFFAEYQPEYFGNQFTCAYFSVLTAEVMGGLDIKLVQMIKENLSHDQHLYCYIVELDKSRLAFVLNHDSADELSDMINTIGTIIKSAIGENRDYVIGVGNCYDDFNKLHESYTESMYAAKNRLIKGTGCIIYIDEVKNYSHFGLHLQQSEENSLINLIKTGNVDALDQLLAEIFSVLSVNRNVYSIEAIDSYFNKIVTVVIGAVYDMNFNIGEIFTAHDNIFKDLEKAEDLEEKQKMILGFTQNVTHSIALRDMNHNKIIYQKIIGYIESNYETDISLKSMSEKLNYSVPYLSYIFKQVSGELFVDYTNKYRLAKAKELMEHTDQSIASIALQVGFTNANNFNRVFKRYECITPGQFRRRS